MKKSLPGCNEIELKDAPNQEFKTLLKNLKKSPTLLFTIKSPTLYHLPHQQQLFTANYEQGNYNIIFKNETTLSKEKRTSSPSLNHLPHQQHYGKLRARKFQHHLQKRNHIEQRKENLYYSSIIE
ncbi:unnamed protein product [Gordionus sp. m RMFG-2023]